MTFNNPSEEQIRARAHLIYLERGSQPGHEIDDWLQAEYELMQLPIRKIAELTPPKWKQGKFTRASLVSFVHAALLLGANGLPHLKQ